MKSPCTYAEWLPLLDRFRSGDDSSVQMMEKGSIEWTNVVAERWTRQVAEALGARLQALSRQLQASLDRARGDYFVISGALLTARRGLTPLRVFAGLRSFPETVRTHLQSELDRWVSETQKWLDKSAIEVRHDQGRLLKTLRDNPLTAVLSDLPIPAADRADERPVPPVRGRRVT
jgi:hypothetical protein